MLDGSLRRFVDWGGGRRWWWSYFSSFSTGLAKLGNEIGAESGTEFTSQALLHSLFLKERQSASNYEGNICCVSPKMLSQARSKAQKKAATEVNVHDIGHATQIDTHRPKRRVGGEEPWADGHFW